MTMRKGNSHAGSSDAIAVAEPNLAQQAGLMHRSIALDLNVTCQWHGIAVRIDTNSPAILRAAQDRGFNPAPHVKPGIDIHWEFVVENGHGDANGPFPLRVLRDGDTVFVETGQQGWFAFDPETGDGAGFLAAADSEEAVEAYFRAVTNVIESVVRDSIKAAAHHD